MLIVSDVHGAFEALAFWAGRNEPLVVLGDLLNWVDYRTFEGLLADVAGTDLVAESVRLRAVGDFEGAWGLWRSFSAGREVQIRARFDELISSSYQALGRALAGARSVYVTYGNVDRPDLLREALPDGVRFVDAEVVEIEGLRVGIVGGGVRTPLRTPGEVADAEMAARLSVLGPVDILGTHVPPAIRPLSTDVVGGRTKESQAVLDYLLGYQPSYHYFGDVHQPQAVTWRVGRTRCINAGYFRATGRAIRHG